MLRLSAIALALIPALAFSGAASAQGSDDQAACRDDAIKLCRANIGKPDDMRKCLVTNKDKLSAGCKKVVEQRGG
jgi:hypothetical protein